MRTYKLIYIAFAIIFLAIGCRKDDFTEKIIKTPINDPSINVISDVTGLIMDSNGEAIFEATIVIGQKTVLTDERGVFLIRHINLNGAGTKVTISKDNFFDNHRIIYPNTPKEKAFISIKMTPKGDGDKFLSSQETTISITGGATVKFESNSINLASGGVYSGEVTAYSHWYDPTDSDLANLAPANLEGTDKNGNHVIMYTYGMIAVELYGAAGEKLQIAPNQTAEISLPIPSSLQSDAPESMPLWSVDEISGKWIEESTATKSGSKYIGLVSHFSFWNCDVASTSFINIEGYLQLTDGTPLSSYPIHIKRNNSYGAIGYTNSLGYFHGLVPNEETLTMVVTHCGVTLVEMEIGPFSSDTDLGDFVVELTHYTTTLTASLKGCINEGLPFAYGITNTGHMVTPDDNGNVSTIFGGCGSIEPKIKFYDGQNLTTSDEINIDKNAPNNNLGEIIICNQVDEFILISVEGEITRVITNPEAHLINGNKIDVLGMTNNSDLRFELSIPGITIGDYNPSSVYCFVPNTNGQYGELELECNNLGTTNFPCDQLTTKILSIDLDNLIITGTYEGYLDLQSLNLPIYVEGSFRVPIVDIFDEATVDGEIWVDLNENGSRDINEEDKLIAPIRIYISKLANSPNKFFNGYSILTENGKYTFSGLRPGDYFIYTGSFFYEPTMLHIGDQNKDNDFNSDFKTDVIHLSSGQIIEHIDFGIKPPNNVSIIIDREGCAPDLFLTYKILGGLKPYTVELSTGDIETTNNTENSISVGTGGDYSATVTDAIGNTKTYSTFFQDYYNTILGIAWLDSDSGEINYFDNEDKVLTDVLITLKKSTGEIVSTTQSSFFKFLWIPYGDYYIEAENISGYSLVDKNSDEPSGSSINPSTYKSDVFSFTECNSNKIIYIGYKED